MTDNAGTPVQEYRYDACGNIEVGESYGGYAFISREWDPEIKLYYYRARYLDPRTGMFIAPDPIGKEGGLNLYDSCMGTPVRNIDPFGLKPGHKFKSRDEAAIDAYKYLINIKADFGRVEFGGLICRISCDEYVATGPVTDRTHRYVTVKKHHAHPVRPKWVIGIRILHQSSMLCFLMRT